MHMGEVRMCGPPLVNLILSHLHEFCNAHPDQQAAPRSNKPGLSLLNCFCARPLSPDQPG